LGELLLRAVVELGRARALVRRHFLRLLEEYLTAYLDGAGLRDDPRGPVPHDRPRHRQADSHALPQANAYTMIRRRAAAGIETTLGNYSFRATGITAYLKNGGTLEKAAAMRTTPQRARRSFTTGGATR
jgi:hypothetical protein